MRYREGDSEAAAALADQQMFLGTAAYALAAGLLLCVVGLRSRQYWLGSMGLVLVCSSAGYLMWRGLVGG